MKKILLLLLAFCGSLSVHAQIKANATLFTEEGERFWVILNGERQNNEAQTNVKITGLNAPVYKLKVIFENPSIPEMDKNLYLEEGSEVTYTVRKNNKGEYVLRLMSSVPLAQAPTTPVPGQYLMIYGTPPPPPATTIQQTTTTQQGMPNDNVNLNINLGGLGVGMNVNTNGMGGTTTQTTTTTTTTTTGYPGQPVPQPVYTTPQPVYTTPPPVYTTPQPVYVAPAPVVYVAGYNGPVGCPVPMSSSDFSSAKNSVASKSFDQTMLETAKTIVSHNCLTVAQVEEMVGVFGFENSKLEFAKYAYNYTYDKGNYYRVADRFSFSSSQEELMEFINAR